MTEKTEQAEQQEQEKTNLEDEELELPDLEIGIIVGLTKEGGLFLKQITPASNMPIADQMVIKSLLELACDFEGTLLQDRFSIGAAPRVAKGVETNMMCAHGIRSLDQKMGQVVGPLGQILAQVQHTQSQVLQTLDTFKGALALPEDEQEAESEPTTEQPLPPSQSPEE